LSLVSTITGNYVYSCNSNLEHGGGNGITTWEKIESMNIAPNGSTVLVFTETSPCCKTDTGICLVNFRISTNTLSNGAVQLGLKVNSTISNDDTSDEKFFYA